MSLYTRRIEASLLQSGLVGALGYRVVGVGDVVLVPRTASGIAEDGTSANYYADVPDWETGWVGTIVWDAGAGTLAREPFLPLTMPAGAVAEVYDRALRLGDVRVQEDGSWVYYDVQDPTIPRVKFARLPRPGGRTVILDPP